MTDDVFVAGDGTGQTFIPGTTTQLTLSVNPGSVSNVWIFFDAAYQADDQIASLVGQLLTLSSPIPVGVQTVTVKSGSTTSVGTPSTGTVVDASVAANAAIQSSKLSFLAGSGAVPRSVQSKLRESVSVMDYGAKGDGNTDDTVAIQAAIDGNKGGLIVFPAGKTFLCAGVTLNGATYNNTTLRFDGWMLMKPDAGGSTFGGAWVGILFKDCDGVTANPKVDGNRVNMTDRQQIFAVGVAGATNLTLPTVDVREIRGDGLYIGQSNWLSSSANPSTVKIGRISAINSADDGRNAVSIISGSAIDIQYLLSIQVGAMVAGFIQPGGLDIEPDFGYESCSNIWIGYADIITAGTSGLGVFGKSISGNDANRDWNCFDIRIDGCKVLKTGTTGSALSGSPFTRVADLKIKGVMAYNSVQGQGPVHDFSQRVVADWTINNMNVGVQAGSSDLLTDFSININAANYSIAALRSTNVARGRFTGRAFGASAANSFGVQCHNNGRSGITQIDVAYEIDAPFDGQMARAFRNEPSNLVSLGSGTVLRNCDATGYAVANDAFIRMANVLGLTSSPSMPSSGSWLIGTFVLSDAPVQSAGRYVLGWSRLNTGSNNVLNTDWSQAFVAYV
jgi:hypothetical protein